MRKVFVIGDSISVQYGPYLKQYLDGFMHYDRKAGTEEALKNLDIPQGANGGDSPRVKIYLEALDRGPGLDADFLLVNCGLHDIKRDPVSNEIQVSLDDYRENLEGIIALAGKLGTKLVWMSTTPCDEAVHNPRQKQFHRFADDCAAYNETATAIMQEAGVPIIDLFGFTSNLGPDIYCDHVHMHEPIRQQQAAFIAGWLHANNS